MYDFIWLVIAAIGVYYLWVRWTRYTFLLEAMNAFKEKVQGRWVEFLHHELVKKLNHTLCHNGMKCFAILVPRKDTRDSVRNASKRPAE